MLKWNLYRYLDDRTDSIDRTVILGSGEDVRIPLAGLAEAFCLGDGFVNCSAAERARCGGLL